MDSWAVDYSAPGVKDGSVFTASFFNILIANIRNAVSGMGVTLDQANDNMLLEAIQQTVETHSQAAAPHPSPAYGDKWFDPVNGILFEFTNDGTQDLWIGVTQ